MTHVSKRPLDPEIEADYSYACLTFAVKVELVFTLSHHSIAP